MASTVLREQLRRVILQKIAENTVLGGGASWVFYRSFVRGKTFHDVQGLGGAARRIAAWLMGASDTSSRRRVPLPKPPLHPRSLQDILRSLLLNLKSKSDSWFTFAAIAAGLLLAMGFGALVRRRWFGGDEGDNGDDEDPHFLPAYAMGFPIHIVHLPYGLPIHIAHHGLPIHIAHHGLVYYGDDEEHGFALHVERHGGGGAGVGLSILCGAIDDGVDTVIHRANIGGGDAAIPPPAVHDDAARVVSSGTGDDLGLQQIAKVLASLGYNEMASSATLLADSTPVVTWPGSITVFGASRRHLRLDHMALGYFPYAELAAARAMKLPLASFDLCLDVAAQPLRGPVSVHRANCYVVHGLHGFIPPLSHGCCVEDAHAHRHHQVHLHQYRRRRQLSARSAGTSAATAASVVRIMIREAISRLREGGFGFVALAMRVKFPELEKLSNLTVFALDYQIIFSGGVQGQGYVSAVRFHIIHGNRLTRADLVLLRPGTVLPTLAGDDQKLVITLGAGSATDEVRVNYIPVKEPDVVINSRVAVHGIYLPFPCLHLANLAASVAVASDLQANDSCGIFGDCASTPMTSATIPADQGYSEGQ